MSLKNITIHITTAWQMTKNTVSMFLEEMFRQLPQVFKAHIFHPPQVNKIDPTSLSFNCFHKSSMPTTFKKHSTTLVHTWSRQYFQFTTLSLKFFLKPLIVLRE